MFCLKCGEAIPDDSKVCPYCKEEVESVVNEKNIAVCTPSSNINNDVNYMNENKVSNTIYLIWIGIAVLSFIFLFLNYLSVIDISYFTNTSIAYNGYELLTLTKGEVALSAYMIAVLILLNIISIVIAIIGITKQKHEIFNKIGLIESFAYVVVTIITFINIKVGLDGLESSMFITNIGIGCILNIVISVIAIITYFTKRNK